MLFTIECVTAGQRSQTRYLISRNPIQHRAAYMPHSTLQQLSNAFTITSEYQTHLLIPSSHQSAYIFAESTTKYTLGEAEAANERQ